MNTAVRPVIAAALLLAPSVAAQEARFGLWSAAELAKRDARAVDEGRRWITPHARPWPTTGITASACCTAMQTGLRSSTMPSSMSSSCRAGRERCSSGVT